MTSTKSLSELAKTLEPQERLKHLTEYSNTIEVDYHVCPTRYYRSGLEMVRMATVYHNEGSLENAYVLYLKFMTLFLDKIRKHPGFGTVPAKSKSEIQKQLREIIPKAEKLREDLLKQYTQEYEHYIKELKFREQCEKVPSKPERPKSTSTVTQKFIDVEQPPDLNKINYPEPISPSAPPLNAENLYPTPNSSISPVPTIDRSNKPSQTYLYSSYDKTSLRTVIVPLQVMSQFQLIAQKNTVKNIETCGILAGKLKNNELIITHMILPKQKGTSDSCTTMNEEELFDFQDQHNLITIGWIHTHPTQTAFLSSVDLHTHCPYQLLMPEAIAIVCAPKYNETGFFVLTPTHGLKFIACCRKTGFHPHPTEPPLFMVAEHVKIENSAPLDVYDLRTDN